MKSSDPPRNLATVVRCITALTIGLVGLAGCSAFDGPIRLANSKDDHQAKTFTSLPSKASIYIYRNQGYMRNEEIIVDVGSWSGGRTIGKTFLLAVMDQGEYIVVARGDDKEELQIEVEAGKIYFVRLTVRPAAVTANASLSLVDEDIGKAGVLECRLVQLDD
jgi:hypothetical protein